MIIYMAVQTDSHLYCSNVQLWYYQIVIYGHMEWVDRLSGGTDCSFGDGQWAQGNRGLSTKIPSACAVSQCTAHQEVLVHVSVYLYVCACAFLLTERSSLSLQTVHDQPSLLHQNSYSGLHYFKHLPPHSQGLSWLTNVRPSSTTINSQAHSSSSSPGKSGMRVVSLSK